MKRILFFLHYNKYNGLSEYILYLLEHIKQLYERIIIISNSRLDEKQYAALEQIADHIILRDNTGFDFSGWQEAMLEEGWESLAGYDSLTLMNDTCFGPLFDMEAVYMQMERESHDFWGMTVHPKTKVGMPGTNGKVPEHLQSYFLCFKKNIIISSVFKKFWNNIRPLNNADTAIQKYETKMTQIFAAGGFSYGVFLDSRQRNDIVDAANKHPDFCINNQVPLLKIRSFINFNYPQYVLKLIKSKSDYNTALIYDYFFNYYNPNEILLFDSKTVIAQENEAPPEVKCRIAIHLHAYYLDVFEKYLDYFDRITINYDLYITTNTEEKKKLIQNYLDLHQCGCKLKEIFVIENRGRDILPWLTIVNNIGEYDVVGHFHTKKSIFTEDWYGITWQDEYFELLLSPINRIIQTFQENEKVGIIIPEIPYYYRVVLLLAFINEKDMHIMMNKLWQRMGSKKRIDFSQLNTAIMAYGSMFWYRPAALKPLFQLNLSIEDIPQEPVPTHGTILHAIERMPVYIAWNEGYDYRVMIHRTPLISSFADNMIINREITAHIDKVKHSLTYKTGQALIGIPKAIRNYIKKR